ncbi:putative ATP-dependent RNA helicase DHX57 isoform X2 [Anabrus simplex]
MKRKAEQNGLQHQDSDSEDNEMSAEERELILNQRMEEKVAIEAIYDKAFEERIANRVWVLHLKLDYILDFYCGKIRPERTESDSEDWDSNKNNLSKQPVEMCRFFLKGSCRFGAKCRFSHVVVPTSQRSQKSEEETENHLFQLEFRFPEGSKYPLEPACVYLSTSAPRVPASACLSLSQRLLEEAKLCAQDEQPCVYMVTQLLIDQTQEMLRIIKGYHEDFLDPNQPLFPIEESEEKLDEDTKQNLLGNQRISLGNKREARVPLSDSEISREDNIIAQKFVEKQTSQRYRKFLQGRKLLPAWSKSGTVLKTISDHQVVVISGETGCGKSTQVPQFLLDEWLLRRADGSNQHVEIICTQPRRLSAIGVAERVAEERAEKIGNSIGYQIRLESKMSSSTRLLFCTTGILLRRLEGDPTLKNVSHIIVDEVHERSEESDFLLLILRDLLPLRPDLKVILMSATLNAELFSSYFSQVPIIDIPGRTFHVDQYFLEDIIEAMNYTLEENSPYSREMKKKGSFGDNLETELNVAELRSGTVIGNPATRDEHLTIEQLYHRYRDYSRVTKKSLYLMDHEKINYDLIEAIIVWIVEGDHEHPRTGSILVFLPGMAEITTLHDQLSDHPLLGPRNGKFILVPLHSSLTSEEQALVFRRPKEGVRKIVLSTNIAETSVTIDDCVFVIDSGRMKEKRFDSNKNMESLEQVWVSRANAMQRKGRAGRVMPGVCIHLFTEHRYTYHFLAQPVPELHRVPLEQLLLRIKTLPSFSNMNPHQVLGRTLEPPPCESIDSALVRLKDVGALDLENQLTPLGRHLAALPVDVRIGKLIIFGAIFCCLDSVLTMAACLSYKSPFVSPFSKRDLADSKKKEFATLNSDQLTVLKAYKMWLKHHSQNKYAAQNFAEESFLSWRTLITLADIKHQFLELLASIGFVPTCSSYRRTGTDKVLAFTGNELNANGENQNLLRAILCAALYPNVVKVLTPEKSYTPSVVGAIPKQHKAGQLKFKTRDDGYVFLHPSSVNYSVTHFTSPYLVYQEKVKTSRVYIRDCSMVPIMPLVLFSGCGLQVELNQGDFLLSLADGWIKFLVDKHEVAELLQCIRNELVKLLEEKIEDPGLNLLTHERGKKIINTIVHLVTRE